MSMPAMDERILDLMPEEAKAVLLLLGRHYPYEVTQAINQIAGERS